MTLPLEPYLPLQTPSFLERFVPCQKRYIRLGRVKRFQQIADSVFCVRANLTEVPVDLCFRWKNRIVYLIAETGRSRCNARAELLVAFHDGLFLKGPSGTASCLCGNLCFTTIVGSTPTGKTFFLPMFPFLGLSYPTAPFSSFRPVSL